MACDHTQPCGCNQDELTTLPDPCDNTLCVDGEPCEEIIDCNCVRYNGAPIPQLEIVPGASLCDIITDLIGLGGIPGQSAYDVWITEGNEGTPQDFLDSLKGTDGTNGTNGTNGTSGTGNQGNTGSTGNNGNTVESSVEPPGANCTNGGVKIVNRSGISNTILSTQYICNNSGTGAAMKMMMVQMPGQVALNTTPIPNISFVPNGTTTTDKRNSWSLFRSGIDLPFGPGENNLIIDDWGSSFNLTTGIWTCPEDGYYDISYYIHLTRPPDGNGEPQEWGGMFTAGVMNPDNTQLYGASSITWPSLSNAQYIDIEGNRLMVPIPQFKSGPTGAPIVSEPYQLVLRVLNKTGFNYSGQPGDIIRFAIRKVRDL